MRRNALERNFGPLDARLDVVAELTFSADANIVVLAERAKTSKMLSLRACINRYRRVHQVACLPYDWNNRYQGGKVRY